MSHGPGQRILHVGQDVGVQNEGDGDAGMGRRIRLREHRTQPGTVDCDCWRIMIPRLVNWLSVGSVRG